MTITAPPPPPAIVVPGDSAPKYGAQYAPIFDAHGVPLSQAEPPAGAMGDTFAVRPACEQLTWVYQPTPAPAWQAVSITPDHGRLLWHQWIVPFGNAGTRLDAQKALSAGGVCKLEGKAVPLLTHADIQQGYAALTEGTLAPAPRNWEGWAMMGGGAALLSFAGLAHYVKSKDVAVESTAQFEVFANAWRNND